MRALMVRSHAKNHAVSGEDNSLKMASLLNVAVVQAVRQRLALRKEVLHSHFARVSVAIGESCLLFEL